MSIYFSENNNFVNLKFNTYFFKEFKEIYFSPDENIKYYDNNHLNYISSVDISDITYTFHGFYKDKYFVILINSYDNNLQISIDHKEVIIIKSKWIKKTISEDKSIWILDIPCWKTESLDYFLLDNRNKIFDNSCIDIDNYLKINNYKIGSLKLKYCNEIRKKTLLDYIIPK